MGLLSIFRRGHEAGTDPAAAEIGDTVAAARTRARRRLIGAAVLLMVGIIGFPLVFETRPRPIPIDIPIEIPRKDGAPALTVPPPRPAADAAARPPAPVAAAAAQREEILTETAADAGREVPARAAAAPPLASAPAAARPGAPAAVARKPAASAVEVSRKAAASAVETSRKPAAAPTAEAPRKTAATGLAASAADGARAQALLEAKPTSAEPSRFIVQVGAFAEADSAREARAKVEKLGLKTYTQIAQTPGGSRIRVRAGPFSSRAEADAALAKARAAGLTAVVLTL